MWIIRNISPNHMWKTSFFMEELNDEAKHEFFFLVVMPRML